MKPTTLSPWMEADRKFRFPAAGESEWQFDATQPDCGITLLSNSAVDHSAASRLANPATDNNLEIFALDQMTGLTAVETYTRHDSLVIRYAETPTLPLEILIQLKPWQNHSGVRAIEFVVSMHTSLLDAVPITSAICRLPAGKVFEPSRSITPLAGDVFSEQRSANNRIRVIDSVGVNHLIVVHPGDLQWMSLAVRDNRPIVDCRLRIRNLEKGVIRRARMLYARLESNLVSEDNSITSALSALADEFENSQLPLSA